MKIGLYFGSFNPIHNGHLIIATHCLNFTDLEQIWIVVSPQNPFKIAASLLGEYDRLHLINKALEGQLNIKVSDVEFKLPKPSYTITTLQYLEEKYPIKEINKLTYTVLTLANNSLYENQLPYIIIQSSDASIIDSLKGKEYIVKITEYKYNYYKLETTHNNPTEFAESLKHKYGFVECYYEKPVEIHHCVF